MKASTSGLLIDLAYHIDFMIRNSESEKGAIVSIILCKDFKYKKILFIEKYY